MRLKIKLKIIIDIFLLFFMLISALTGIVLMVTPSGPGTRAGQGAGASILDLASRSSLKLFHDWSSILLIAMVVFHLMLNGSTIVCYFKRSFKTLKNNGCEKI
ncbi:MAG: DUF4405 domain-containing protein [Actinomycetota bacterium]|nr:DUF4405 domain-containing protein [Actinomycetota bacterium]